MIKIRALNGDSLSDEEAPTIRREAQEEIVLEQYNIALRTQAKQNHQESIEILQKLIEDNIPELENNGGLPKSMSSIKFSCHCNLGNSYLKLGNVNKALENYSVAAELDSTDVTLWYKIGKLSLKEDKFRKAAYAFSKGLECNETHWPCLDHLISVLYAMKDTVACLVYIGKALMLDADYTKGLVLRKQIYTDNPATKDYYQLYNPDYIWEPALDIPIDKEDEKLILEDAQKLSDRVTEIEKSLGPKPLQTIPLPKALEDYTWLALTNCIISVHDYMAENEMGHFTMIDLNRCMSQTFTSENSLPKSEKFKSEKSNIKSENNSQDMKFFKTDEKEKNGSDGKPGSGTDSENAIADGKELDKINMDVPEIERRGSLASEGNVDCQDNNGTPVQTDNDEEQAMETENDNNENNGNETDGETPKNERGRPKGTKRKRDLLSDLQIWGWHSKRKQPKKVTKDYKVEDALNRLIPKSLLKSKITSQEIATTGEDSMNTMDLYNMFVDDQEFNFLSPIHSPKSVNYEAYFGTDREKDDVLAFWNRDRECVDAVTLVKELVFELSKFWHYKWPRELVPLYLKVFGMFREHCDPPQLFCSGLPFEKIREDALATLLFAELTAFSTEGGGDIHPTIFGYLMIVSGWQDDWNEAFLSVFIRFYWLQSHVYRKNNENDLAINALELILEVICEQEEKTKEKFTLNLPNCFKYGYVTKQIAERIIKHLNMLNALSSIENLYNAEKYTEVASIIKQTFEAGGGFSKVGRMGRPAQLGLLLHSLWFTNVEDCFIWAEECLNESLQNFRKANNPDQDKWEMVIDKCLGIVHEIIKKETVAVVDLLHDDKRCRLVESLSKIICYQLNAKFALVIPLGCVTPWILMHYILLREEQRQYASKRNAMSKRDKIENQKEGKEDNSEENDEELPPSVAILFSAHEFLGPKGWCLTNEGELLLFILDSVLDKLDTPILEPFREKLEIHIEQALFCLYTYPSKKNKISRHLVDHNVKPLPLTWERSFQLYHYYGPDVLPEFNDLKSASISTDLESLLRRIIALVPCIDDLHAHLPKIMNYIYNKSDEIPASLMFPNKLRAIYYLIGDYHFKQGEFNKCIKYFQLDLCINPERLDSWACLALSYANQLESKLNFCEDIKNDTDFLDKAKSAERCFHRALEIKSDHLTLWIERGSFEYMVHSVCSRMIKFDSENYSMEKFEILENEKEAYLDSSGSSLKKAIAIYETEDNGEADERWLQYYILGKIAEKKKQEPMEYLQYYLTACNLLHENKATYPEAINYNNPQQLSVEALELHYRIHASVLKYLELHEGKEVPDTLGDFFKRCMGITTNHFKPPPPPVVQLPTFSRTDEERVEDVKKCISDMVDKVEEELKDKDNANQETKSKPQENALKIDEDDVVIIEDTDEVIVLTDSDDEMPQLIEETQTKEDISQTKKGDVVSEIVDKVEIERDSKEKNDKSKEYSEEKESVVAMETELYQNQENVETETTEANVETPKIADVQSFLDKMMEETMKDTKEDEDQNNSSFDEQIEEVALPIDDSRKASAKNGKDIADKEGAPKKSTTDNAKSGTIENDASSVSSSSSSSSDSSSSDSDNDSSSSDSSSSDEEGSGNMSTSEILQVVDKCIQGLEACCLRLEGNYKALYRLAHVFFHYKNRKDYTKCKQILLGQYRTKDGRMIQGLFFERKMSNFFNGIWRIPCTEIDRPGSLAAHMNRCISLLLQALRNTNDNKTLIELCLQLKKEPDRDKIYIKNTDRLAFSEQAMNMCLQSFRSQMKNMPNMSSPQMLKLLHEIFKAYQKVQKHFTSKEGLISSLLVDAYKCFIKEKIPDNVNVLDLAVRFCQQHKPSDKHRHGNTGGTTSFVGRSPGMGTSPVLPSPSTITQQTKKSSLGRPRGRPPLPKLPKQGKQSRAKSPVTAGMGGGFGSWANQNFTYEYLKQYQEQLIKQYSQNLTYSQMAQLCQMMNQGQLNNPAMASAVTNQFLTGSGILPNPGLLPNVSSSGIVTSSAPTPTSLLDNQSLINSVFKSGVSTSNLSGLTFDQLKYLDTILKTSYKSNKSNKPSNVKSSKPSSSSSKKQPEDKSTNMLMKDRPNISITPVGTTQAGTSVTNTKSTSVHKSSTKQDLTIIPSIPTFSKSSTITSSASITKSNLTSGLYSSAKHSTAVTTSSSTKSNSSSKSYSINPMNYGSSNVTKSTAQSSIPFGIPTVNFGMPSIGATISKTTRANVVMSPSSRSAMTSSPSATQTSHINLSPTRLAHTSPTSLSRPISTSPGKTLQEKLAEKKKEQQIKHVAQSGPDSSNSAVLLKTLNLPSLPSNLSVSMSTGTTTHLPSTSSQAEIRSGTYPSFGVEKLPSNLSVSKSAVALFGTDPKVLPSQATATSEATKSLFKESPPKRHTSPTDARPVSLTNEVEITLSPKSAIVSSNAITKPLISVKKDLFVTKPNSESKSSRTTSVKCPFASDPKKSKHISSKSALPSTSPVGINVGESILQNVSKAVPKVSSNAHRSSQKGNSTSTAKPVTIDSQEALKTLKKLSSINISVKAPSTNTTLASEGTSRALDEKKEDVICIDD